MLLFSTWYIIYEVSVFFAVLPLAIRILPSSRPTEFFLCSWLTLKILVSSLIPTLLTFLALNTFIVYMGISLLLLALGAAFYPKHEHAVEVDSDLKPNRNLHFVVALFALISFMVAAALPRVGPFGETDSLVNFSYIWEWSQNVASPYYMAYHYSSFWEANYVPIISLGGTDALVWWPAAQAIGLLAVSVFILARFIVQDRWLSWGVLAASITFPALWFGVSGVGTLKNDMIYNAGLVVLIVAFVSCRIPDQRVLAAVLGAAGLSFLSVKYSGPVLGLGILSLWIGLGALAGGTAEAFGRMRFVIVIGVAALLLAGHYYIKNIVIFGNPLYPYPISLGMVTLAGVEGLPKSSLLLRATDWALLREFLKSPTYGLSGPVSMLVAVACSGYLLLRGLIRRQQLNEALIGSACLFSLLIYASSNFSDWLGPNLVSLRYATGAFAISLVAIAATGRCFGKVGSLLALALFVWCIATHVQTVIHIAYRHMPVEAILHYGAYTVLIAAIAVFVVRIRVRFRPVGLLVLAVIAIGVGNRFTEINRERYWLPEWEPVVEHVSRSRSSERIFLIAPDDKPMPMYDGIAGERHIAQVAYPAVGPYFQNEVVFGRLPDLIKRLEAGEVFTAVAVLAWVPMEQEVLGNLVSDVEMFDYELTAKNDYAALLERSLSRGLPRGIAGDGRVLR